MPGDPALAVTLDPDMMSAIYRHQILKIPTGYAFPDRIICLTGSESTMIPMIQVFYQR